MWRTVAAESVTFGSEVSAESRHGPRSKLLELRLLTPENLPKVDLEEVSPWVVCFRLATVQMLEAGIRGAAVDHPHHVYA